MESRARACGLSRQGTGEALAYDHWLPSTAVMIDLMTLEAVDERGRAALRAPERMKPPIRDVAAYEIVVRAGERLQKEVVEIGTRRQLTPVEAYAPHWVLVATLFI